jgi:hypothetical protein
MKHTEGPWKLSNRGSNTPDVTATNAIIAEKVRYKANARLIAAAPEMLEALHIARMQMRYDLNTRVQQPTEGEANRLILEVIEKAIMKAESDQ